MWRCEKNGGQVVQCTTGIDPDPRIRFGTSVGITGERIFFLKRSSHIHRLARALAEFVFALLLAKVDTLSAVSVQSQQPFFHYFVKER
jgi:hypothetical protein